MIRTAVLAAFLSLVPAAAWADCTVSVGAPLNFGTYPPFSSTATTTTGNLTVACTSFSGSYVIALNAGTSGSGSFSGRAMSDGSFDLGYQIYTDAAHSMTWGDGTAGTVTVSGSCSGSCTYTPTLYGEIAAQQKVGPGSYTDSVLVTVTY
jgi:spore coat protein U-like protein